MAVPILGTPCPQFLDSNGNPLVSGLVYVYAPDTTTARASYPTADDADAGTNANANPVVLDSNGYANGLWGVDNTGYKISVTNSAGVVQWTANDIMLNRTGSATATGMLELATNAEARTATSTSLAVTPEDLRAFSQVMLQSIQGDGTANAQTVTPTIAWTALTDGSIIAWVPTAANTGATTLAVSGLTAKNLLRPGGGACVGGELQTTSIAIAQYDAGLDSYTLINPASQGGVTGIGTVAPNLIHSGGIPPQVSTDGTDQTPVATEVYICQIFVPCNVSVTGIAVMNGSVASGNFKVGIADSTGAVVATSASTAMSGTDAYQRVAFTSAATLKGPATYYTLLFVDNNTARINTHTFGNFRTGKQTGQTYATGFTTITPPTTFTTAVGTMCSLY